MSIEQQVVDIIKEMMGLDELNVNANFKELELDSLDSVELVMAIEDQFKIEITDDEAENMTSILAAVEIIKTKIK
jgi:acyl carrier protein